MSAAEEKPTEAAGPFALVRFHRGGPLALAGSAWGNEYEILIGGGVVQPAPDFERVGPLAVVDIKGPLVHHKHWCWDSYDEIVRRVACAFESDAERVVLRINSPGGDVDGCFDAARALRTLAVSHKKPLVAYVDGMAASAAYALASASSSILVSSTSTVGSIGIIEGLRDQVAADKARGERYVLVTSGQRKADGNPHVAITSDAVENLQAQVDGMAELFFDLVEELRPAVSAKNARGMQARVFFGANAIREGLADSVTTWSGLTKGQELTSGAAHSGDHMAAKASYLRHMLRSVAESEGDDFSESEKKHAKSMLKALEEGEPDEGAPPEEKGKKAESEGEGESEGKKASKAEGEDEGEDEDESEGKKGEDESEGKKASASVATRLAARVQTLEAREEERETAAKRAKMMATRPDLTAEVRAWLDSEPLEVVERALKTLPKGPSRGLGRAAAASQVAGTRGLTQTDEGGYGVEPSLEAHINRKMGGPVQGAGIVRKGKALELGFMSRAQALAHLKKPGEPPEASAAEQEE